MKKSCRLRELIRSKQPFLFTIMRRPLNVVSTLRAHSEHTQRQVACRSYCDDFVCTSSPAVEQTVRALARDLTRLRTWTLSLFAKDVRYQVTCWLETCIQPRGIACARLAAAVAACI